MSKGNKRPKDDKANMKPKTVHKNGQVGDSKPTTLNGFETLASVLK